MSEHDSGSIAVVDPCPAYVLGLSTALAQEGFTVEQPHDLSAWVAVCEPRVLVAALPAAFALVESRSDAVVFVCLVADCSPSAYGVALGRGADGVAARDASLEEIGHVVSAAFAGKVVLPVDIARDLALGGPVSAPAPVSEAEADWLEELAGGATVVQLAVDSGYSERAMHRHLKRLYQRLGARNRTDALLRVGRSGVVTRSRHDVSASRQPERGR